MRNNFLEKIILCADKGLKADELEKIYEESKEVQRKTIKMRLEREHTTKNICPIQ
jgi:chromosome segregation and condensation protein ScpB